MTAAVVGPFVWTLENFWQQPLFWGEVMKAVATFAGALIISWLTVRWALGRFKREKRWEREVQAYADLIAGVSELIRLNWHSREIAELDETRTDDKKAHRRAVIDAHFRLVTQAATGSVILPEKATDFLSQDFHDKFIETDNFDSHDANLERHQLLTKTYGTLVALARARIRSRT